jgi:hypothetical protein
MSLVSLQQTDRPDVEVLTHGDRIPVLAGPTLRANGWRGGLFVRYSAPQGVDEWVVEVSDGNQAIGFILFASEDYDPSGPGSAQNYLSYQVRGNPVSAASGASVITVVSGGPRALFRIYETVALNGAGARAGGPITYTRNEDLKISENGLLCNDSDVNLAAAGVTRPLVAGFCMQVPSDRNNFRLGLDMKF